MTCNRTVKHRGEGRCRPSAFGAYPRVGVPNSNVGQSHRYGTLSAPFNDTVQFSEKNAGCQCTALNNLARTRGENPLYTRASSACWTTLIEWLERVKGIEPSYSAWEAAALPLSYTRDGMRNPTVRRRCQASAGGLAGAFVTPAGGNAWRVSSPAPGSWSRGPCRKGLPGVPACARRPGGR
jgi:hypothetical protein